MATEPLQLDAESAGEAQFIGLRMGVDEFLELPDDGHKYELLDGVVVMSPRPTPPHQKTAGEIFHQLKNYLEMHPVGEVFFEIDVHLGERASGKAIVYAPDVIFVRADRLKDMRERIVGAPDLVVEVVSRGSRRMDTTTKRDDYERFGVGEYWIVDPQRRSMTFLRRRGDRFVEVQPESDHFASEAVPGFTLKLGPIRTAFEGW